MSVPTNYHKTEVKYPLSQNFTTHHSKNIGEEKGSKLCDTMTRGEPQTGRSWEGLTVGNGT